MLRLSTLLDGILFDLQFPHQPLDRVREELIVDLREFIHHLSEVLNEKEQQLAINKCLDSEAPEEVFLDFLFWISQGDLSHDILDFLIESKVNVPEVIAIFYPNIYSVVKARQHIPGDAFDHEIN
jgi:hypothetical protein